MSNTPSVPSVPSVEIITPGEDDQAALRAHAAEINSAIETIAGHEAAFGEATLDKRLHIGLELARAQRLFAMANTDRASLGGHAKSALSRRDIAEPSDPSAPSDPSDPSDPAAPPHGFAAWISEACPRLKRPVAYKYISAFRALGLPEDRATPRHIAEEIKRLRHLAGKKSQPMPTLDSILKSARPKREPLRIAAPPERPTLALEDAREASHLFQEAGRSLVSAGHLDALDRPALEALKEFNLWLRDRLTARLKTV